MKHKCECGGHNTTLVPHDQNYFACKKCGLLHRRPSRPYGSQLGAIPLPEGEASFLEPGDAPIVREAIAIIHNSQAQARERKNRWPRRALRKISKPIACALKALVWWVERW